MVPTCASASSVVKDSSAWVIHQHIGQGGNHNLSWLPTKEYGGGAVAEVRVAVP